MAPQTFQTIRLAVVFAVIVADSVLVWCWRIAWNYCWLFAVLAMALLNVYWALASRKSKPVLGRPIMWLYGLMDFLVYSLPLSSVPVLGWRLAPRYLPLEILGAAMCAVGVGFAIWSRHVLAGNWNNVASLRDGHALVTHGPYAIMRHPIYFGVIRAAVGSLLVLLEVRALGSLVDLARCFRKMNSEEKVLRAAYPNEYSEYERSVRRLLPYIW